MQKMKATLILENGMTFAGRSIGSGEERICEMVFNTSMTGYQEILTDPSYAGQGIVMSYPLIGNYGVNHEDNESTRPWAEAFIVRHLARRGSNFRCEDGLDSYLKQFNITGIEGVDTRALTRILRSQGTMNGMITCAEHFSVPECLERIHAYRVEGTVERVTRREAQVYPAAGALPCASSSTRIRARQNTSTARTRPCSPFVPSSPPWPTWRTPAWASR